MVHIMESYTEGAIPAQRDSWVETPVGSYLRVGWHWARIQVHCIRVCYSVFSAVHSLG